MVQAISKTMQKGRQTQNAFLAGLRNTSYADIKKGWYWNTTMPDGSTAVQPAIDSNILWGPNDPNNNYPVEDGMNAGLDYGIMDIQSKYALDPAGRVAGYICQFASPQWNYSPRGTGRFTTSLYLIKKSTVIKQACIMQCHRSVFCVSLAFNLVTNDCQTYAVSPEDPRFAASVTAESSYQFFHRDGMEF
uniref:Uncharacterized protein n=1 Tax=Plectus sambesii TaxID=2011161 RepID=A0A914USE7_9BILA